jgi:hypothetical protein
VFGFARARAELFGFRAISLCIVDRAGEEGFARAVESNQGAHNDSVQIELVPGAQIVTKERIEVLSLGRRVIGADRLSLEETVARIWDDGGFPVIPWSPGKWLGGRGRVIDQFLELSGSCRYGFGDIPMRPRFCLNNRFLKYAESHYLPILAGSDPLPIPGDESVVGMYCSAVTLTGAANQGPLALVEALRSGHAEIRPVGKRQRVVPAALRWIRSSMERQWGSRPI